MDKNTITGFVLIAALLIGFTIWSSPSKEEQAQKREQYVRDSTEHAQALLAEQSKKDVPDSLNQSPKESDNFFVQNAVPADTNKLVVDSLVEKTAEIISIENSKIKIDFSTKGGQAINAQLKGYSTFNGDSLILFDKNTASSYLQLRNKQGKILQTKNLSFTPNLSPDKRTLIMRYAYSPTQYLDFVYTLSEDDYMLKYDIKLVGLNEFLDRESSEILELHWNQDIKRLEKSISNEQRYSRIYHKYAGDDVKELSESKNEEKEVNEPTKWVAFKNQFFSSIMIADNEFKTVIMKSKMLASDDYLKSYDATLYLGSTYSADNNSLSAGLSYFFGPLQYSNLKNYDENIKDANKQLDLDKLIPLGWSLFRLINQYFIIPLFNLLSNTGMSMGLIILVLTIIVKIIISPLTYKSFMSSAKMRVLRPQVEEINAKYPNQDQATERSQAVMGLYSKAGANPMSGCIPMLLQMPILLALFWFFPNAIELRHQSFLWATDLSTYDAIIEWGTKIPLIGTHISLFCILMTATNIVYTKFNMDATNTGQQQMPGMKWMMYLMPLVFLFVLNDYPSGLTYYYFVSTLITILLTIGFRFIVDEEKLLAKLEANKNKPKKKSGFMARLEEAQRMQQQQIREQNKKKKK